MVVKTVTAMVIPMDMEEATLMGKLSRTRVSARYCHSFTRLALTGETNNSTDMAAAMATPTVTATAMLTDTAIQTATLAVEATVEAMAAIRCLSSVQA